MYLRRRGSAWWFRRAFSSDLKVVAGSGDVSLSLRTGNHRRARKLAMRLAIAMDDWSEAVRTARTDNPEQPDRALLLRMLDDAMALADSERSTAAKRRQADALQTTVNEYRVAAELRDRLPDIGARLGAINDRVASLKASAAKAPTSAIADLRADLMNEIAKLRGDVQNAHKNQWSGDLLSSKIDDYIASKEKELGGTKHVSTKRPRIKNFVETIGDKPVRDYTRQDFERYRDILDRLPLRAFDRFKTHDLAAAAAANEKRLRPFKVIDDKTVDDDYLTPIKTFFTYLVRHNLISASPAVGVVSSRTRDSRRTERPDEARNAFTPNQINAYFRYIVRKRSRATEDYWLPILALYTGARLNELCQIESRRVVMHNERWHIDLLTVLDQVEIEQAIRSLKEEERASAKLMLKTASARRQIPIHDDLIKIGFIEFVDQRRDRRDNARLFPRLKPDRFGYFSSAVGKRLNLDLTRAGANAPNVSFYSFRHNFSAALTRALTPDRTKDRIMGHLVGGAQGHYGNAKLEDVESAVIERVAFPGVDISPYIARKH